MTVLAERRIILGVTSWIADYKAIEVCRRLVDARAHVVPILTQGALRFVGRTTFDALASERVHTSLFEDGDPIPHTRLGQAADAVLVVPATARVIGAYAAGISSDLLTATLLASRAPVLICPAAADLDPVRLEPKRGQLASAGEWGEGRLAEPPEILAAIEGMLAERAAYTGLASLQGVRVLVTAGGTREPIDAVRVVANRSSGKQGYALAAEAAARGADVTLVTTVERELPHRVAAVAVETAAEMEAAVRARADADVIIMAAAVADFRPVDPVDRKIKKDAGVPAIVLEPTPDILAAIGQSKRPGQVVVGFAAETDDALTNGRAKLAAKRCDLLVVNEVGEGRAFDTPDNAAVVLGADGTATEVPLGSKDALSDVVWDLVVARLTPLDR